MEEAALPCYRHRAGRLGRRWFSSHTHGQLGQWRKAGLDLPSWGLWLAGVSQRLIQTPDPVPALRNPQMSEEAPYPHLTEEEGG